MRQRGRGTLRILSVSAEPARAGSAARTHLTAIRDALRAEQLDVGELWRTPRSGKVLQLVFFQLSGISRIWHSDVVYMRWHVLDVVHVLAARGLGKKLVLEVNGTSDDILNENPALRRVSWVVHRLAGMTLRAADHIIVVSPGLVGWAQGRAPRVPVTFLPNGADASLAERWRQPADPPYAIFVGELARHQGLPTLLEARRQQEWPRELPLVIVGSGALQGDVDAAEDGKAIVYRGRLEQRDAHELLAGASVSISPQSARVARNRLGVTPLKVAESMMLGTPVVGSRLPGLTEIIEKSGTGATFEPDDPVALASAVATAASLGEEERANLRRYAVTRLSWRAVGQRTAQICVETTCRS